MSYCDVNNVNNEDQSISSENLMQRTNQNIDCDANQSDQNFNQNFPSIQKIYI